MMLPRGIRNHNPLNIRRSKDQWKGLRDQQTDVSRLTGIDPDEPIGIPSEKPSRWMMVGIAMAIQENGTTSIDWFAMLRGWDMCRSEL